MVIPKTQERLCLHLPDSDGSHSVGFPGDANGAAITKTPPSYRKSEKIREMSEKSGTSRRRQWCHNHQDTTPHPKNIKSLTEKVFTRPENELIEYKI